jgi:hypothetical protein
MKRMVIGALVSALAFSASLEAAHAAPKKKAKPVAQKEAPQSAEIDKAMGDLEWGMSRDDVMKKFVDGIKEKYRPLIAKATGAIEEDKLRAKARDEIGRIKTSLVEFNGTKTGWDVSFLKGEFTHHNNESMFVVNDANSQNYYFFINGKFWKWYKAFSAEVFQGKSFDQFAQALQGRYGEGSVKGEGKSRWLEWQDAGTALRAVDNNQFYGFYCMVFEHKDTVRRLDNLRTAKAESGRSTNALVESVTSDEGASEGDYNQDIIDRITGKVRRRQDAPEQAQAGGASKKAPASAAPSSVSSGPTVSDDDDPLKGLGI